MQNIQGKAVESSDGLTQRFALVSATGPVSRLEIIPLKQSIGMK
jgi:hypothetical protein